MKRLLYIALALCGVLVGCTRDIDDVKVESGEVASESKILRSSEGAIRGEIVVCFGADAESRLADVATRANATRSGVAGVDALLDRVGGYAVRPVFVVTEKNRKRVESMGMHLWYTLHFDGDAQLDEVAAELAKVGEVRIVEYSHAAVKISPLGVSPKGVSQVAEMRTNIPYDDTYSNDLWNFNNLGKETNIYSASDDKYAVEGADVNILPAWKLCVGDPSIVVAVVDEGVAYNHPDLYDNMWVNSGEIAGNGIDDDGNGYVDDIYGYNFAYNQGEITWEDFEYSGGQYLGDTGHGTHVAGVISAMNNNSVGVCGIAGGNYAENKKGVRIMSVQTFAGNVESNPSNTARGIQYAADNGANILQCSWGYPTGNPKNDAAYERYAGVEAAAIRYFINYADADDDESPLDGGIAIFAAGNNSRSPAVYPGAMENCVSVTAMAPSFLPAWYTNYGPGCDIVAPGGDGNYSNGAILSTVPAIRPTGDQEYVYMNGTSMACPHVSGVAALALSYAKQLGKRFSNRVFRDMLLTSVNDYYSNIPSTLAYAKYIDAMGAGYVDAYKLLMQVDGTPFVTIASGKDATIDLKKFFGEGASNLTFKSVYVDEEDIASLGIELGEIEGAKLGLKCAKNGVFEVVVNGYVGGDSQSNTNLPIASIVTKRFMVISRTSIQQNGGWL